MYIRFGILDDISKAVDGNQGTGFCTGGGGMGGGERGESVGHWA